MVKTLSEGLDQGCTTNKIGREEKKPAAGRVQTHHHCVTRHVLYHCATTAALVHLFFITENSSIKLVQYLWSRVYTRAAPTCRVRSALSGPRARRSWQRWASRRWWWRRRRPASERTRWRCRSPSSSRSNLAFSSSTLYLREESKWFKLWLF